MSLPGVFRLTGLAVAAILFSSCATVLTPIPPAEYQNLSGTHTVRVTPKEGDWHDANRMAVKDSTLTILRPQFPEYDKRKYPVSYKFSEIESISKIKQESLVYIEAGVEGGGPNQGAESEFYSKTFLVIDMGYLSGERAKPERPRWGFGGTIMTAMSDQDFRMGAKARVRYRINRHFSADVTAGPMLTSWNDGLINGFVGGVSFNAGRFLTLRSEYMTYEVAPWREDNYSFPTGHQCIQHPGGYEKVWYNGVALRGGMGWATATVGTGLMFLYLIAALSALGSSN
jgi:hypothetical protein